ncbi:MAG TPA: Asp-tRNA(Asn)/Glu-tRNA(Gln) amidotransferase subunit GatC, partial [Solirubrobacterales bacterium]|nr:Asp-tRNA(Asn)/Glu-tRNA(Gln) amidotransferase subunit GatC [Solirubrobacterales bacterium]
RLRLGEDEVDRFSTELSGILDHVDKMGGLELSDVDPTTHVVPLENELRDDHPHASLTPEQALANAPESEESSFRVPSPQA